jgi:hypothetical protein
MSKTRKLLGGAALVAVAAAGGSAFTAGNSMPAPTVTKGYGSQTISGVSAQSIDYNTNVAKDTITSVGLALTGDTTAKTIQLAFNDAAPATCSESGTFDDGTDLTTYLCEVTQSVSTATKFALIAE